MKVARWHLAGCEAALVCLGLACSGQAAPEQAVIRLPLAKAPVTVDGALNAGEWDDAVILGGNFIAWFQPTPIPNSPLVYIKRSADRLYIAYDNPLGAGERPVMRGAMPDNGGICADNAVEFYIMPEKRPGDLTSFIQFGGNGRGAIFDTKQTPQIGISDVAGFTIPWLFKNSFAPGHWYAEVSATFAQLGIADTANGRTFDADFDRDGGRGAWGYMCTFSGIAGGAGIKVIFDDRAPTAQWLSFGEFEKNLFNPRLRLKSNGSAGAYMVSVRVAENKPDAVTGVFKELHTQAATLELGAGETKDFTASFPLEAKSAGLAYYRITDAQGAVVFYRCLPYTTSNPPRTYPKVEPQPLVVKAEMAPSYGRILASADILDLPGDKTRAQVNVAVSLEGQDRILASAVITNFPYDYGQTILQVSDGPLPAGAYVVRFASLNADTKQPIAPDVTFTLTRKIYEWENNSIGITDKVMHPWTPMKVEGDKAQCWGREYTFDGTALPASIATLQPEPSRGPAIRDVLAAPVRIVAETGGKVLTWKPGAKAITAKTETRVDLTGSAEAPGLKAEVQGSLEFDGFYKIHLKLTPTGAGSFDSIRVEVPMPTAGTRLFNHSAEAMRVNKTFADLEGLRDGVIWNSKSASYNSLVKGNFIPIMWMGDEDRGVAWMCDNDKSWVTTFDKPCLDVVRKGKETTLRMHLLNKPGELKKPIEVTFSLQATPVKPRPAGGSWKSVRWYGWGFFDRPLIYDGCFDLERKGRTAEENPWYREPGAKEENRWWRYFCFNSDRIDPNDPAYGQTVKDFAAEWYVDAPLAFVQNKAHTDFILWAYQQWHERTSLDGAYHDNTFAVAWPSLINDRGWIDDEGRRRAGYWVMDYREFAKRERAYWLSVGPPPVLISHVTDAPIIGYLGFSDFWMDGENGGYPDAAVAEPDFVDRWYNRTGMANLRITLGRQWGTMPKYFYVWKPAPTQAVLGLFDIDHTYWRMNGLTNDFGLAEADCEYIPYWDVRRLTRVTKGGPDVLTAIWKRPGRVRLHIANLSQEDRRVDVRLDAAALGLPANAVAYDDQSGVPVPFVRGTLRALPVARHNYRMVVVAAPGVSTVCPARDAGLEPKTRIPRLCDEFTTLSKDWQPKGRDGDWCDLWAGNLRITGAEGVTVSRPFGEDNCSVQVRIQAQGAFWDGGPSLMLSWSKDKYVQFVAGNMVPMPNLRAVAVTGGKSALSVSGPAAGTVTWAKITLSPTAIDFFYAVDGKAWTKLGSVPRTGFEGAPPLLILGLPTPGANEYHVGNGRGEGAAFFADLVTGREYPHTNPEGPRK
jgi:hypothetical protein